MLALHIDLWHNSSNNFSYLCLSSNERAFDPLLNPLREVSKRIQFWMFITNRLCNVVLSVNDGNLDDDLGVEELVSIRDT